MNTSLARLLGDYLGRTILDLPAVRKAQLESEYRMKERVSSNDSVLRVVAVHQAHR